MEEPSEYRGTEQTSTAAERLFSEGDAAGQFSLGAAADQVCLLFGDGEDGGVGVGGGQ
jgi:hypothetical protein